MCYLVGYGLMRGVYGYGMDIQENIRESYLALKANKLRSILTMITICIGIACLVGMLTAIEAMRQNFLNDFAKLGANTLTVRSVSNFRNRRKGTFVKYIPPLKFSDILSFSRNYDRAYGIPSIVGQVTGQAVIRFGGFKTNPNKVILGVDERALFVQGVPLARGRNFTVDEVEGGNNVAIIGYEIYEELFQERGVDPIGAYVLARGGRYKVIGYLEHLGTSQKGDERYFLIPLQAARRLGVAGRQPFYETSVYINDMFEMDTAEEVARQLMRRIRGDRPQDPDSFDIRRSDSAERSLNRVAVSFRIGGYTLGFITLMSACIGLMNIMLVYVKERVHEIGLRKAVGATSWEIRMQFLTEAVFICQLGGISGILLGILFGNLAARIAGASFTFPYSATMIAVALSTLVGVLAGYIPARNAARVDPIESLRNE